MSSSALWTFAAVLLGIFGLLGLRRSWRHANRQSWRFGGWLLLLISTGAWIRGLGPEFGITLSLTTLTLLALVLVIANQDRRPPVRRPARAAAGPSLAETSLGHKAATFLVAGVLAGVSTCMLTVALTPFLPTSTANQMATAAMAFPVLWGVAAFAVCLVRRPGLSAISLSLTAVAAALYLYL